MPNQSQAIQKEVVDTGASADGAVTFTELDARAQEQQYRAGAYGLLAGLLRSPPDQAVLERISGFASVEPSERELELAMSMLGLASSSCSPVAIEDEFHALFIGLGRGELVPYGSWYLTGFLMEKPLDRLRDDLRELGFQRGPGVHEPEDHAAALCEVMLMLISDGVELTRQSHFFNTHMTDWLERFFIDLSVAKAAVFYRAVGRFGIAFTEFEKRYQAMQV